MKRLTYIFTILSFLLFPLSVFATTKVELKQVSNNEINTVIHFEDGFIGGIDLTLKLDKNIKVTNFKFNNSLSDYYTYYNYQNNTLNIKITTGGVDKKHNLVNEKKELNVGSIFVEASTNTDYKIEAKILTVINNSLKSATINDLTIPTNEFTYKLSNTSSSNDKEENKDTNSKDTETQDKDSSNKTDTDNNKDTVNKEDKENNTSNNQNTNTNTSKEDDNKTNSSNSNSNFNANTSTNNNNKEDITTDKETNQNNTNDKTDSKEEQDSDNQTDNTTENNNEEKEDIDDINSNLEEETTSDKKETKNIFSKIKDKKEIIILTGAGVVILSGIIFKVIKIKKK